MSRPDPAYLDSVTAAASTWLRRCNGKPEQGVITSAAALRIALGSGTGVVDVGCDAQGLITWRGPGGNFTAEPVCNEPPPSPA